MRVLIVGSGAREHAIARAFARSVPQPLIFCCATHNNPGIRLLTESYWEGDICNVDEVMKQARSWNIDLAIIGPEAPLERGLVDVLEQHGIPTVGPKKKLAQLETSKRFTRELAQKYQIAGALNFRAFSELTGVMDYLYELGYGNYVIKADGLMGGKGVKVAGEHLHSFQEAYQFCDSLVNQGQSFVIEEKLIGQEFSLLNFCDGEHLIPMPLVQDHKRAFINDKGPNTGGMGSYSDANHSLPFLLAADVVEAQQINQEVINAVALECGERFKGFLYGSFMATRDGIKLIEYNVRLGDPEAMNVLSLLESDFLELCNSLVLGRLHDTKVRFKPLATVCKYAVPLGYPEQGMTNRPIDISQSTNPEQLYLSGLNEVNGELYTNGARALAVVGIASTIAEAERMAEEEVNRIQGDLFHREDIGTATLINQRIQMMNQLRQQVFSE